MKRILILTLLVIPLFLSAEEKVVGYLGVGTEDLSTAMKTALGVEQGLLIKKIYENSPAAENDLKVGDIIISVEDEDIDDLKTLRKVVYAHPGEKVKIILLRDKEKLTKEVELGEHTKSMVNFNIQMPDIDDIKTIIDRGSEDLKEEIEQLKLELEKLKAELEELKQKTE